jgi:hypothetical protein
MNHVPIGAAALNWIAAGNNNVAIGYNALLATTTGCGGVAIGVSNYKIIILTHKLLVDDHVQKYCKNESPFTSYIVYDIVDSSCFYAINTHSNWVTNKTYTYGYVLDKALLYYNKMYPRWMTLFLSIQVYLGDISYDILVNIMSNYIIVTE